MSAAAVQRGASVDAVRRIATEVAAKHAGDVDVKARIPSETLAALREQRLLSAMIPREFGGDGLPTETIARMCFELGRACGASAMVFAMHQIQIAAIIRHIDDDPWFEEYLRKVSAEQRLIASATSEAGTGGDMGRSVAAVERSDDEVATFEKNAPTVSYGAHADDLFVTLRRDADAEPGDQVVVLVQKNQFELDQTGTWDPLGMRGTCSPGYTVRARFDPAQILSTPFSQVATETMVPISHIFWSHLWLGIATDAFDRARAFVRAQAKTSPGAPPPTAIELSRLWGELSMLRAEVSSGLTGFLEASETPGRQELSTMASALRFNSLKITASERAPRICQSAMRICGIVGYKNDTPFSVGRHLRDTMSACLMVANDRIHQTNASLLLIAKDV